MGMTLPNAVQYSVWIDLELCDLRPDARFHPDDEIESLAKAMDVSQLVPIIVCRQWRASLEAGKVASPPAPLPEGEGGRRPGEACRFEVLAGVGRVLAARKRQWKQIRADIYENLTELQKLDMIFSENEDRKNASPLYQAQLLKKMMESGNLTQQQLAESMNKSQSTINDYLSLEDLSPKVFENISALIKFGMRHFKQLLRIENMDDQWKFAEIAREKGLSSSELGALIDKEQGIKPASKAGRPKGDKNVGVDGFAFFQKGAKLRMKAICDLNEEPDALASKFKAAFVTWRESHPSKPSTLSPKEAPHESVHVLGKSGQ